MPVTGRPMRRRYGPAAFVVFAFGVVVALVVGLVAHFQPPPHRILMFNGGVPGTAEAHNALQFAHDNGVEQVNYSSINERASVILRYLDDADDLGVKVWLSVKDLLGPTDLDPINAAAHNAFGRHAHPELTEGQTPTNEQNVDGVVQLLDHHPAVAGYLISDERPEDPGGLAEWKPYLKQRNDQIHRLSDKPTLTVLYWTLDPDRLKFLEQVKPFTDKLMVDFYPEGKGFPIGPRSEIRNIGAALHEAAGQDGSFAIQAFPWSMEPDIAEANGFTGDKPFPTANAMVRSAAYALRGGAYDLAIYSYEGMLFADPNLSAAEQERIRRYQQRQVEQALRRIHRMPGFLL